MTSTSKKLILLCTGLGNVQRGFEMYITSLAEKLSETELGSRTELWTGGDHQQHGITVKRIANIRREGLMGRQLKGKAFLWEQRSFFMGILPSLLKNRDAVFYLGEYQLYCYLYKFRKVLRLKYSLVLYTGGQAFPGLFNNQLDFVHHVTDVYLDAGSHIPGDRQWVLPHFLQEDFVYDNVIQQRIKKKANGKQVVLSVGLIDSKVKKMDLLVKSLVPLAESVFPVILGDASNQTAAIEALCEKHFGKEGYLIQKTSHAALGNWYSSADLFVLCSPRESFGLAMVEAMYHDLPVICRDVQEARFVLGPFAIYQQMNSPAELTLAIETALQSAVKDGQAASFIKDRYSWSVLEPAYIAMFQAILKNEPAKRSASLN